MTDALTYMKENRDTYHTLASANGDPALSLKVFLKMYHLIFPDFRSRFPQLSEAEVNMLFQYFTQGCSGVLGYWEQTGMKESIPDVIRIMKRATDGIYDAFS